MPVKANSNGQQKTCYLWKTPNKQKKCLLQNEHTLAKYKLLYSGKRNAIIKETYMYLRYKKIIIHFSKRNAITICRLS